MQRHANLPLKWGKRTAKVAEQLEMRQLWRCKTTKLQGEMTTNTWKKKPQKTGKMTIKDTQNTTERKYDLKETGQKTTA